MRWPRLLVRFLNSIALTVFRDPCVSFVCRAGKSANMALNRLESCRETLASVGWTNLIFSVLVCGLALTGEQMPIWLGKSWNKRSPSHSQVLQEVRSYYQGDGFLNEEVVRERYKLSVDRFLKNPKDSHSLITALAWHELALSDGNIFDDSQARTMRQKFVDVLRSWQSPVTSFEEARTLAICLYYSSAPDTFTKNRLLEKLYTHDKSDTELELAYLTWACLNQNVAPSQLTLERLLQKQEKLEFRRGGRSDSLSFCYSYLSFHSPKSKRLLEKGLQLKRQYFESLPSGHSDNTEEFRQQMIALEKNLRSLSKNWSD